MEMNYYKQYSPSLNKDVEFKVYGHSGKPLLFIPCQDGRFYDFENYKMIDVYAKWIDAGELMVFSIDTIDQETWSNANGDPYYRGQRYEQWINYITREMVPLMRSIVNERNGWDGYPGIMVTGSSLGATHAANLFFRFPDLFDRLLALSGIYTAEYGFGSYMDETIYNNSPTHFLANMPLDHPFINQYNQKKAVICVGQGAWEIPGSTRHLEYLLRSHNVNTLRFEYWGYDVKHDWDWWYKQVDEYIPYLLFD